MQQQTTFEDVTVKDMTRANRMLRSRGARTRRKNLKEVRETRMINQFAKQRRLRKRK